MKTRRFFLLTLLIVQLQDGSAAVADALVSGFTNPPESAKPQTWWHWMNGNISKEGITADLEAMKQIGLGGATIVNVDCGIPAGGVPFMSAEWREDFKFAVQEADRLGLKLCVENCAGWSSSGGPWNSPANSMQRLTSSETHAHGPVLFDAILPQPATTLGFYRDVAVLAYQNPRIKSPAASGSATSAPKFEIQRAAYGADGGGSADVRDNLLARIKSGQKSVTASSGEMGGDPAWGQVKQLRLEFTLDGKPDVLTIDENETLVFPVDEAQLTAARLLQKSSVSRTFVQPPPVPVNASEAIPREGVLDLTSKLASDGRLRWEVPPGDWIILRLGHTPVGVENHPAPDAGRGLECDKMSKSALDAHWDGFMRKVLDDAGPLAGRTLDSSLIDSYEVGGQDWTEHFREEFRNRRGYDPLPYLPAFTHQIVDSQAVTERFLWDMRRTVADLFADNYFGHFATLCKERGLLNAIEPYTGPFESLQCGAPADTVMGEFWSGSQGHPSVKLAASIAHIYGKSIVAAESFTAAPGPQSGRWSEDPYSLKSLGDLMFCQGLNRYVFHRFAMQPWMNQLPGMTMGEWGFHFDRTETWWTQGKSWIDYITHCEFLLQQGRAVTDAAYFTGESAPVEMRVGNPALPAGYDFDAVNADVLLHGATVKDGRITLASGASYAVLVLPPNEPNMTPQVLECLRDLVLGGATLVGPQPKNPPGLTDFPRSDARVNELAAEMWGKCDGVSVLENNLGKGRVIWGKSLADIFAERKLKPDFEFKGASPATRLAYAHRSAGAADIYFVSNQRRSFDSAECTFRVNGKLPELWHPDTGVIEPAPVWSSVAGRTTVRLDLDPAGSVFVIFRGAAGSLDHVVEMTGGSAPVTKLQIQHAVYAATDGAGEVDVTEKLAGLVHDNELIANVRTETFSKQDPAPFHIKELQVDYTLDGIEGHKSVREGETLALSSTGSAPQWEPGISETGTPVVRAWSNGRIQLRTSTGKTFSANPSDLPAPQEITGAWNLTFPSGRGAPASVRLEKLISWPGHPDDGVRYFSGTATYEKEIEIAVGTLGVDRELWLDLGAVQNFAEVSLNGHEFGVLWKPPFRVNVTSAARAGANRLLVKVTNLWPNRLIGDEHLPPDCEWDGARLKAWPQWLLEGKSSPTGRHTFATWRFYDKSSPLLESGLLGPVRLHAAAVIRVK